MRQSVFIARGPPQFISNQNKPETQVQLIWVMCRELQKQESYRPYMVKDVEGTYSLSLQIFKTKLTVLNNRFTKSVPTHFFFRELHDTTLRCSLMIAVFPHGDHQYRVLHAAFKIMVSTINYLVSVDETEQALLEKFCTPDQFEQIVQAFRLLNGLRNEQKGAKHSKLQEQRQLELENSFTFQMVLCHRSLMNVVPMKLQEAHDDIEDGLILYDMDYYIEGDIDFEVLYDAIFYALYDCKIDEELRSNLLVRIMLHMQFIVMLMFIHHNNLDT